MSTAFANDLLEEEFQRLAKKMTEQFIRNKPHWNQLCADEYEGVKARNAVYNQMLKKVRADYRSKAERDPQWERKYLKDLEAKHDPFMITGDYSWELPSHYQNQSRVTPAPMRFQDSVQGYVATDKRLWSATVAMLVISATTIFWSIGTFFLGLLIMPNIWLALVIYTGIKGHSLRTRYQQSIPARERLSDHWLNKQRVLWWAGVIVGLIQPFVIYLILQIAFMR